MPDNKRDGCPLLLRECQELRGKFADNLAVERDKVRDPRAPKDREQQQRVFRRLSKRFRLVDQQTGLLHRRFGFRRRVTFGVHQSIHKSNLELDLLTAQCGRAGLGRDLRKRTRKLLCGFDQRGAL
jgi:hypothetical protein